jgi:DNA polymerase I-like protein with 3'-5' exonuclease and polymerase domains
LSSSKNPRGTGSNAQNVDREARDIFLADEGCVGVEVDLSQAEARIDYLLIYMLTGDNAVLDKARLRPDEYDQHTENAAAIFNKPASAITKEERYLGKKAVHAAFRDMQGQKLADELLKEGRTYTAEACDRLIRSFRRRLGEGHIESLFRWVRGRIIKDRYLENSWGRRLWFTYDRLDAESFRRGYSFDPQSEVADLMNQYGLIPLWNYLEQNKSGRINAHVHDSLFFSVKPSAAYEVTKFLVDSLEKPRVYWGVELVMPCEVKVGARWKASHEWKRMPSQEEFQAAIGGL